MTTNQSPRPTCPTCQAPLRDIELAMVRSQHDLSQSTATESLRRMQLFCGHRVELVIDHGTIVFRPM